MTYYLSALNPFGHEPSRSLVSKTFQAGHSLVEAGARVGYSCVSKVAGVARARLNESSVVQAVGRNAFYAVEKVAIRASQFLIRKSQKRLMNGRIIECLPTVKKAVTDKFIEDALAPTPISEDEKAKQTYLNWILELIKNFIKQKILRTEVTYLVNHAVERAFAKGRLQSTAFNLLTRINVHAPVVLKEVSGYEVSEQEIEKVLKESHQAILKSDYYNDGLSWFGKICIAPKVGQAFTREAFDGYVAVFSEQMDTHLGSLNGFLETDYKFKSASQRQAFAQRMVLEVMSAIVQEISVSNVEVDNPIIDRGLEKETQKLMKSLQPLIPENPDIFETILEEEEFRLEDLEKSREQEAGVAGGGFYEQSVEGIQFHVDESQDFVENHPWLAKTLNFFGYDTSAEAMQDRLVSMRLDAVAHRERVENEEREYDASLGDEELEARAQEADLHFRSMDAISKILSAAIHSPKTVDILFDRGFSVSSLLEKYRVKLIEEYYSLDTEDYGLDFDENDDLQVVSMEQSQNYSHKDDVVLVGEPVSTPVEVTPMILAALPSILA